jgi:predicted nucleic acid-binding protein
MADGAVVDASAMVEMLAGTPLGPGVRDRLKGHDLHAPAHFDAEVLSALGRLQRDGRLTEDQVRTRLDRLVSSPVDRHPLPELVLGAWRLRKNLRLVDGLYAELARSLDLPIVTTDSGMASASPLAQLVASPSTR